MCPSISLYLGVLGGMSPQEHGGLLPILSCFDACFSKICRTMVGLVRTMMTD